jgi:hypothetical protein
LICLFLDRQEFSASDIYGQLITIIDSDAIAYFTVTKYLKETRCTADKKMTLKLEGLDVIDQVILAALDEYIFLSVQDLVKKMYIPSTMV